jgi:hypothetical protein
MTFRHARPLVQLLVFERSHFVQRFDDHTHEDIDCLGGANQSLHWVGCIFKDNTGCFDETMQSLVMDAAQRRSNPDQVPSTPNVVTFYSFALAAYHTRRAHPSAGFHAPPPMEK